MRSIHSLNEFQESFAGLLHEIAKDKALYDTFYSVKNSYHQTAIGTNGVIAGRYPTIVDLCAKIKYERERLRGSTIASQQAHRTELEDARAEAEAQEAKDSKGSRKSKSKVRRELLSSCSLSYIPSLSANLNHPLRTTKIRLSTILNSLSSSKVITLLRGLVPLVRLRIPW